MQIDVEIELIRVVDINGNITIDSKDAVDEILYPDLKNKSISITSGGIEGDSMFHKDVNDYEHEHKSDELTNAKLDELRDAVLKMKAMEHEINSLSQRVQSLELMIKSTDKAGDNKSETNGMKTDKTDNELYRWLKDQVKLVQYYDLFVKNGFDNLKSVALISDDVLLSMGIDLIGHRTLILFHVLDLKRLEPRLEEKEGVSGGYTHQ